MNRAFPSPSQLQPDRICDALPSLSTARSPSTWQSPPRFMASFHLDKGIWPGRFPGGVRGTRRGDLRAAIAQLSLETILRSPDNGLLCT